MHLSNSIADDLDTESFVFDADRAHRLVERYLHLRDAAASNDRLGDALEAIRPLVNAIAVHYTLSVPEREDVVQECLIHIAGQLETYNHNLDDLRPWLSTLVRHKAISIWRGESRRGHIGALPLDERLLAAPVDGMEPDAPLLNTTQLVEAWLISRYPSIDSSLLARAARLGVATLADGDAMKVGVRLLRDALEPPLACNQVVSLYNSILVFLRSLAYEDGYGQLPDPDVAEFSLLPELRTLLGDDLGRYLYTVFKGMYIHFRVK